MNKEKIVYYRGFEDSVLVSINYSALVYIKYFANRTERFPMGSQTDRIEAYLLYVGYNKTTKQKFEELLNKLQNETK